MDERWQLLKDLVADALERAPADRPAFVDLACARRPELRPEVEALLAAAVAAEAELGDGYAPTADPEPALAPGLRPGDRLGPYTIRERLGEGGFSEVHRAEQREPIQREVAVKLLKLGRDGERLLQRFAAERRTLERMDHPHVARVLDAGATADGRPFVVMELVRGRPITDFAATCELGLDARIALMLQVCDAVEHAHRRGVIHRDLKPSNVLVERVDGADRVKVIDFGIAKLLDDQADAATADHVTLTALGTFLGTPAYASPEQFELGAVEIDTRADVFALGVMLYELLTGARPSDDEDGAAPSVHERVRRIRETVPLRPSQRVRAAFGGGATAAAFASTTTGGTRGWLRAVQGELDWITMRALETDRERRYPSVAALAEDLRRHLRSEAVTAGPPSATYRLRRFARRHRVALTAALLAVLSLVGGGIAAAVGFVRASDSRDRAEVAAADAERAREAAQQLAARERDARQESERARAAAQDLAVREREAREQTELALAESSAVEDFLAELLTSAQPDQLGRDVTVRELLEGAAESFARERAFAGLPAVEVRLRTIVGVTWQELGDYDRADAHLARAEDLARATFGPTDPRRLEALFELAQLRSQQTRNDEADALLAEFERLAADVPAVREGRALDLAMFRARAKFEQGDYLGAAADFERIVADLGQDGPAADRTTALSNLAQARFAGGDIAAALVAAEAAWILARDAFGADASRTITAGRSLGMALVRSDVPRAIEVLRTTRDASLGRYGPDHERTLGIENYLAFALQIAGDLDGADAIYTALIPKQERALGRLHRQVLMSLHNLGMIRSSRSDLDAAVAMLADAADRFAESRGADHPETLTCIVHLLDARARRDGHRAHAADYAARIAGHDAAWGADHPQAEDARGDFAEHLVALGDEHAAAGDIDAARTAWEQAFPIADALGAVAIARRAAAQLAESHAAAGDVEAAARWRREAGARAEPRR